MKEYKAINHIELVNDYAKEGWTVHTFTSEKLILLEKENIPSISDMAKTFIEVCKDGGLAEGEIKYFLKDFLINELKKKR